MPNFTEFLSANKNVIALTFLLSYFYFYNKSGQSNDLDAEMEDRFFDSSPEEKGKRDYLVDNEKCKIKRIKRFDSDIMKYFAAKEYEACTMEKPISRTHYNFKKKLYILTINKDFQKFTCCYKAIIATKVNNMLAETVDFAECVEFKISVEIPNTIDNIIVNCYKDLNATCLAHGHSMIPERAEIRERLNTWKKQDIKTKTPLSVLVIGFGSISRINLLRAMPKTAMKLLDDGYFQMRGYTLSGGGTYPNLLAMLTGHNKTTAINECTRSSTTCPIIWKLFRDHGYVTAFADDGMSTSSPFSKGFSLTGVDFHLKPYLMGAEQSFPEHMKHGPCLGYQRSSDDVLDYSMHLAKRYSNDAFFGVFWVNTYTRTDISDCSAMDLKTFHYLNELSIGGILKNTIVMFFSDYGFRLGPSAPSGAAYSEERLPFFFISLPKVLQLKHPDFVRALQRNKAQLTNPYDIHMTLKHVLTLSGRAKALPKSYGCPVCQSILNLIKYPRGCQDIGIDHHWCICTPYESISLEFDLMQNFTSFIIDHINNYLHAESLSAICDTIELDCVNKAFQAKTKRDNYPAGLEIYRIILRTKPANGIFEATLLREPITQSLDMNHINRLNLNPNQACISDVEYKKFCHCHAENE